MRKDVIVLLAAAISLAACRHTAPFVWMDQWSDPGTEPGLGESALAAGDTVSVRVMNQESISTKARVRDDGKIAVPLLGDVAAAGKRPDELAKQIAKLLTTYMVNPSVTVNVDEVHATTVSVIGEVARPGAFPVRTKGGLLDVLASAGGFTEFASDDRIFVLRRGAHPVRLRCAYRDLIAGTGAAAWFVLRDGDVIVVE